MNTDTTTEPTIADRVAQRTQEMGAAAAALAMARELGPVELQAIAGPMHKRAQELAAKLAAREEKGRRADSYWRTRSHAHRWYMDLRALQAAAAALAPHAARVQEQVKPRALGVESGRHLAATAALAAFLEIQELPTR